MPELLQHHLDHLKASAISIDVIKERGYESVLGKTRLADLGFSKAQQRVVPGILVPLNGVNGTVTGHQYKPDHPRQDKRGRVIKYENPAGSSIRLDVPPRCQPMLGDPGVPIFFTEGIKKADSLASQGGCAVALNGVWGFRGKNPLGGTTILADFDYITLKDRDSYVVFDSDYATNPYVRQAQDRLLEHLRRKGANVSTVYLPPSSNGEKVGVDDFLAAGHTIDDLKALGTFEEELKLKGGYRIEDGRLCRVKIESGGAESVQPLCNFVANVVRDITLDNGVEQHHFFEIQGQLANSSVLPRVKVAASSFAGLGWVVANWGVGAVIAAGFNAKDSLREAIQLASQDADRSTIFTFTGWKEINGRWVFLSSGISELDVELPPHLSKYRLPAVCDNPKEAVEASLRFLDVASFKITIPMLAATYGAPLGEASLLSLVLFLYGMTGALKTTLACLAISHYGGPFTATSVPATFEATGNFIEHLSSQAKDVLLLIDDLFPQSTEAEAKKQQGVVQRLIRGESSHVGRGRLRPDASPRPSYTPRGFIVSTGEILPTGTSTIARILIIDVARDQVNLKKLSASQAEVGLYPYAMRSYLDSLSPQMDKLKQELPGDILKLRETVQQRDAHLRVGEMVAQLLAGWDKFLEHAENVKAITHERRDELLGIGHEILVELGKKQTEQIVEERPSRKFLNILGDLFAQKRIYLRNKYGDEPDEYESWGWERKHTNDGDVAVTQPGAELLGWVDDDNFYLLSEASYRTAARFAREQGSPLTIGKRTLHMQLRKEGVLVAMNGKDIIMKTIAGQSHRVIRLTKI